MDWLGILALLAIGCLIGALGGLFGIGGGLIAVPVLGLFFGMTQQHAQGTSLVMVVPNIAVGLWNYAKHGQMDLRIALALAFSALPLTFIGAHFATSVASEPLRIAFAAYLVAIALYMTWRVLVQHAARNPAQHTYPWPFAIAVGAGGGMLSGLFSAGGAVFSVPLVSFLFKATQATAQGFGLALVAPGLLANVATYAVAGDINWLTGIALGVGGMVAVPYGVALAHRLPERQLKLGFAALLVVSAVALVLHR